jgi:hypothetical protein
MHARIAMFEGTDPGQVDQAVDETRRQIEEGMESPPEGLEGATEVWLLVDRNSGKTVGITLFENEEDLRRGHETLSAMSPGGPQEGMSRTDVGLYEVAVRKSRG